ncbi:MAG: D-alanyl-D-alanine carboxypeptidase family protein [Candidatus Komeilibacteria bacterium]|nr:D-alanyl-D-alanine carboxypeptidase family protein [Candidatus Komeilibacteria bacterium]
MQPAGKILTYQELLTIASGENQEALVNLNEVCPALKCQYEKMDMLPFVGDNIFVRKLVADKLAKVQLSLQKINPQYQLKIVYGYRHPAIQQQYFAKQKEILKLEKPDLLELELNSLTHNFVAVPEVAGHPTGGAIDLTITTASGDLDMGTKIADFSDNEKIKTYSEKISAEQLVNREILLKAMLAENFVPFYGEWWHFSYGDKEWAYFNNQTTSLYSPLEFKI